MTRTFRQEKFLEFRRQYPWFSFERQEYSLSEEGLSIRYSFSLSGRHHFHPTLFIPRRPFFSTEPVPVPLLENLIFHIGLVEMISYWKAACPPRIIIHPFRLEPDRIEWWKHLCYQGLGEFLYLNGIETTEADLTEVVSESARTTGSASLATRDEVLIPVGGGKDSAVTLEMLGRLPGSLPVIMNPRGASLRSLEACGLPGDRFLEVQRTIDPELLRLNEAGFLNGHTPFSALLAMVTVLGAVLTGKKYIALSNESSANEPTIGGTGINHQYSKSFAFETGFREYARRWITSDVEYFSFLRPLNELQIASLFAEYKSYHPVFRSCNAGSKTDSWCGACPKCLFTWIILAPFITEHELVDIFGRNLLDDPSLEGTFCQLTGLAAEKPFECVGTMDEVNLAMCETISHYGTNPLPYLAEFYRNSEKYRQYGTTGFRSSLAEWSVQHHLPPRFMARLREMAGRRRVG